ncbi:hypothetical protein [Flavobacterium rhizosphaerae]|uniref:DUF5681 domain-containing protein n=1 Tax=Flavobacterium rhizosphaerae TaxID=3163298 RepID=A0ABW8Z132_9FLAO
MERKKTGGRRKGTPNKTTAEIRSAFQCLVEDNLDTINKDLKIMEPEQRLKYIIDLAKFVVPQLKAIELSSNSEKPLIMLNLGDGTPPDK